MSFNEIESLLDIDGLVKARRNTIANALELRLSCTNSPIYKCIYRYQLTRGSTTIDVTWEWCQNISIQKKLSS